MILSSVIVVGAATWLVTGPEIGGSFAFMLWDILITWLLCLVLGTYTYVTKKRAFREHQDTPPPEEESAP
ncbi:hypothetical protein KIK06_24225 [Nocardiopsis sp. EMB25]|uniref:hypothetical protein n=1 Tax=Nocardiopsis sp. EMB25 TaxID=2835867 RepID=UPI0022851455|nr:hypothetical protein [Nocardiopsis sp. EMB25]MCY9786995.1 hypothetical protein [Nocardiopsis sp. EMB25]